MRGLIICNSCDWSGLQDGPAGRAALREGGHQGGQPSPSEVQPGCTDSHGSSSHAVQVIAPWPSPTGCRGISAATTKPWGRSKRGPWSPECHQEFCDQVCWQQNGAGCAVLHRGTAPWPSAVLHRHGLCLPTCSQHRDSGEGFLFTRRIEQCRDNVICGHQHHLCPADPSLPPLPGLEGPCTDPAHSW